MKKWTVKSASVFLVIVLVTSFLVSAGYGQEWTQTGLSNPNAWETVSHENWETISLEGEAGFTYETKVENFSMWRFKLRMRGRAEIGNEVDNVGNYFKQHITFYVGDYPNGDYVKIEIIRHEEIRFGVFVWHSVNVWFDDEQVHAEPTGVSLGYGDRVWEIVVWRNTTDSIGLALLQFDDWDSTKANKKEVRPEFKTVGVEWFNNVTIVHDVYKGLGYGWCGGEIRYEQFITNQGIVNPFFAEEKTLAEQIAEAIVNAFSSLSAAFLSVIPEPYRSFLVHLGDYAWFMVNIILALFSSLAATAPVFLSVYGLYLLGLSLTCLNDATYQPLYDHFLTVYNFLTGLMSKVIAFLQWLWNQIEVW